MIKSTLYLFAITLLSSLVSGCFGYLHVTPTECSADLPVIDYIYKKDNWRPINKDMMMIITLPDKDDFIKEWGEPDETIKVSDDETTLVYKRKIWCGSVPAFIIPVPLVLPTCDGFDRITFKGDTAKHIHFKRSDSIGVILPFGAQVPRACPLPYTRVKVPTYSKGDNIPDNKGLVVLYRPKSFVGGAHMHIVKVEENLLVPLYNGSYYNYLSTIGEKEFTYSNFSWQRHLKINIEEKQKYYLRFKIIFPTGTSLEVVPAEIAEKEIAELTLSIPQK